MKEAFLRARAAIRRVRERDPFDPLGKSAKHRLILKLWTALWVLGAGAALGCLSLYFGALYPVLVRLRSYFSIPALAALNILPVVLLLAFLWVLTDRPWLAFLLTAALVVSLTYANYFKVVYRDDPLVAEDIENALEAFQIVGAGGYTIRLGDKFTRGIRCCVCGVLPFLRAGGWGDSAAARRRRCCRSARCSARIFSGTRTTRSINPCRITRSLTSGSRRRTTPRTALSTRSCTA